MPGIRLFCVGCYCMYDLAQDYGYWNISSQKFFLCEAPQTSPCRTPRVLLRACAAHSVHMFITGVTVFCGHLSTARFLHHHVRDGCLQKQIYWSWFLLPCSSSFEFQFNLLILKMGNPFPCSKIHSKNTPSFAFLFPSSKQCYDFDLSRTIICVDICKDIANSLSIFFLILHF